MAISTINLGNVVNDGLGDNLRTAFQKVNDNFAEMQTYLTVTASNAAGSNGYGVFAQKVGTNLQFKNLLAGNKITIDSFVDSLRINSSAPDSFTTIVTDNATMLASAYPLITIKGSDNISVVSTGQNIKIDTTVDINRLLLGYDFGSIDNTITNIFQLLAVTTAVDFGTITSPSNFSIDLGQL